MGRLEFSRRHSGEVISVSQLHLARVPKGEEELEEEAGLEVPGFSPLTGSAEGERPFFKGARRKMLHHCKRKNDPRTMRGLKNEILMAIINKSGMKLDLAQRQLSCSPGELKS